MKLNLKTLLLVGAVATAASGSVFANTNIIPGSTGDGSLFLNVVDQTSQTSYTLDLSAFSASNKVNEFNGSAGQSFTLTGDANWSSFTNSIVSGDTVVFNVVGADTSKTAQAQISFTSAGTVGANTTNTQIRNQSWDAFLNAVNSTQQASTTSIFASASGNAAAYAGTGVQSAGGVPNTYATVGTAMNFYNLTATSVTGNNLTKPAPSVYAGTWNLTDLSTLTYSVSSVPLPMPLTLLLSGLALMGVIARRGKSQSGDVSLSGLAA
jgi:hypothetical protein